MAEEFHIPDSTDKQERYKQLIPQIKAIIAGEDDITANLANIAAALKYGMGFFWVGFYLVKNDELVLGPFQGPVACTRIKKGMGVCGTAWAEKRNIIVADVEQFPGHIACSSASRSEIVLLGYKNNEVALELDVDSDKLNDFDEVDENNLYLIMKLIEHFL